MDAPETGPPTARIELTGRDGNMLAADAAGPEDGPTVILLHGGGQTRHSWGTSLVSLAGLGWRVYSVDLRGHGESAWAADGDYSLDAFAGDVRAVADQVGGRPALVGASLGGLSALSAVGESGEDVPWASALILVDVAPHTEEAGRERIGAFMMEHMEDGFATLDDVADAIQAYNPHRPRPKDLSGLKKNLRMGDDGRWFWHWDPAFIRGGLGSTDETRVSLVSSERLDEAARRVSIPTLLVRGLVSDLLSEAGARQLLELVPHAQLVSVAGAGHMVAGDRNDLFNDAVVEFLTSTDS